MLVLVRACDTRRHQSGRYHRSDAYCAVRLVAPIEMTKDEAVAHGFKACRHCAPDFKHRGLRPRSSVVDA